MAKAKPAKPTPVAPLVEGTVDRQSLVTLRGKLMNEEATFVEAVHRTRGAIATIDKLLAVSEPGAGKAPAKA